ncbi:LTA synthase family protein [Carboxylicivirga sp. M1479]|uniref:LTA synthase family protein n=1 Tax=Carboxylicivirga sp. M1479 TaxID=2594476 RepID=UPI001177C640|nr:LTA synthase family protein [Carboxylicivirga sp. M1479]TRX66239.1 LTA synthase family protein [Carboxylicivirga sp. M1479]
MILTFLNKFWRNFIFWLLFFAIHRLAFIVFNHGYADGAPVWHLLASFGIGLRLDSSFTGYIMGIVGVVQLLPTVVSRQVCLRCFDYINFTLIVLLTGFMLGDTFLYSYWGRHMDLEALEFMKTPAIVMASLHWYEMLLFALALIASSYFFIKLYLKVSKVSAKKEKANWKNTVVLTSVILITTASMIAPIRGSVGVAPINTGVAYFSTHRYANHSAINPMWNLAYSMKKMDATKVKYRYMDDALADSIFDSLTRHSGDYKHLLTTKRPNVVVILLESFAAHAIEALGGASVTPTINSLIPESILFSNIRAAANRSDKGLVATLAGYQVLPAYSIIRFPEKTSSLPFLPKRLKENGYQDLTYIYGGDIKFKNMNSFVTQAGFEKVVSVDDFDDDLQGEKWGVHDEYTFRRLVDEMKHSAEPYFKFFFTLSSHEPFDVPMERLYEDDYHNSIAYTDKCLGEFFETVKKEGFWDNTLFVLLADHGVGGPDRLSMEQQEFYHIPMLWTGGAVASKDTVISKIGSQTDMARTLLSQLDIPADDMRFSKNILDESTESFAFFTLSSFGMALLEEEAYQAYNNNLKKFISISGASTQADSLKAKAYLQVLYNDSKNR